MIFIELIKDILNITIIIIIGLCIIIQYIVDTIKKINYISYIDNITNKVSNTILIQYLCFVDILYFYDFIEKNFHFYILVIILTMLIYKTKIY